MKRLSGEDAAWLQMESAENLMVVSGFLGLAAPLEPARLEQTLRERLPRFERFSSRVVIDGRPRWEPAGRLELGEHLSVLEEEPEDDRQLAELLGRWVSRPLERARPLWRMQLVRRYRGGSAVLFQIHHAIADGFALLQVLLELCDPPGKVLVPRAAPRRRPGQLLAEVRSLARIVGSPIDPPSPLKGQLHVPKVVAWSEPISLAEVKAAARSLGCTINDLLTAAVAGALRQYLLERQARPTAPLHAMVPVNLRGRDEALARLGNRFGLVIFPLPVGLAEPLARLGAVKQRMARVKGTPDARVGMALLQLMGHLPRAVEKAAVAFFAPKASVVLTNVPGPREQLWLAGCPISRIMFWVPQSGKLGLGISLMSYRGELSIGVISDAGLVPDPDKLVDHLTRELLALGQAGQPEELHA